MKRILLAAIVGAGLAVSAGAHAQDWSGPEIGVQGGYGWGSSGGNVVGGPGGPFHYSIAPSGFLGGVHGGYNWQFGQVVLGVDADAEGSLMSGHSAEAIPGGVGTFHDSVDFDSSIRGKLGWSFGRVMPYATGGIAFDHVHTRYVLDGAAASSADMRVGWTGGGGVAYALTPNWSSRPSIATPIWATITGWMHPIWRTMNSTITWSARC